MRLAFLFPGQGAQTVGMGKALAERHAAAREVFESADRALGFPLSTICWEGPEDELCKTVHAQPALLTHGVEKVRRRGQDAGERNFRVLRRSRNLPLRHGPTTT